MNTHTRRVISHREYCKTHKNWFPARESIESKMLPVEILVMKDKEKNYDKYK